jgi:hypothetical protein
MSEERRPTEPQPTPGESPRWRRSSKLAAALIGAVVVALLILSLSFPSPDPANLIAYSDLLAQVRADRVKEAAIDGQRVWGGFTVRLRLVDDRLLDPEDALPPGADDVDYLGRFVSTIPDEATDELVAVFDTHGVTVRVAETGRRRSPASSTSWSRSCR